MRLTDLQRGLLGEMAKRDCVPYPMAGYTRRTFRALSAKGLVDLRSYYAYLTAKGRELLRDDNPSVGDRRSDV